MNTSHLRVANQVAELVTRALCAAGQKSQPLSLQALGATPIPISLPHPSGLLTENIPPIFSGSVSSNSLPHILRLLKTHFLFWQVFPELELGFQNLNL
jgi:hypothetical protein